MRYGICMTALAVNGLEEKVSFYDLDNDGKKEEIRVVATTHPTVRLEDAGNPPLYDFSIEIDSRRHGNTHFNYSTGRRLELVVLDGYKGLPKTDNPLFDEYPDIMVLFDGRQSFLSFDGKGRYRKYLSRTIEVENGINKVPDYHDGLWDGTARY